MQQGIGQERPLSSRPSHLRAKTPEVWQASFDGLQRGLSGHPSRFHREAPGPGAAAPGGGFSSPLLLLRALSPAPAAFLGVPRGVRTPGGRDRGWVALVSVRVSTLPPTPEGLLPSEDHRVEAV